MCYMDTITHREMRNNSADVLRRVEAGESLQVTNNGRLAAVISPAGADVLGALIAQGEARPARGDISDLSRIRRGTSTKSSTEILEDARGRW